jgi:hypothetical protein
MTGLIFWAFYSLYRHFDPLLPERIAQHFDGAGHPNGWASPKVFWGIGAGVMGILFCSFHLPALGLRFIPNHLFSLPNRDHWLSPMHREASIAWLENSLLFYGNFMLAWMVYVFWRVCEANLQQAPLTAFGVGMVVMLVVTVLWIGALLLRFRAPRD